MSGRPRSERAQQAILRAATELFLERGLAGTSVDEIAERAGVGKATIYRRWPSKELLALDALAADWQATLPDVSIDTGSLRGDLLARIVPWVTLLATKPYGRVVAGLVAAAQADPAFASLYLERFVTARRGSTRAVFERARSRGELRPRTDLELALDLLYGPIYHRLLHGHAPLGERFATEVVDSVIDAVGAAY
ncbi:MAG TPA: TetR/AcrR family transcriptional regulator [Gaiellaceae bacterium]|nr:TetR/AcrR family transcriptional regulator [Gaiellaceae bacterium]